jgi:hypothetical protein
MGGRAVMLDQPVVETVLRIVESGRYGNALPSQPRAAIETSRLPLGGPQAHVQRTVSWKNCSKKSSSVPPWTPWACAAISTSFG